MAMIQTNRINLRVAAAESAVKTMLIMEHIRPILMDVAVRKLPAGPLIQI